MTHLLSSVDISIFLPEKAFHQHFVISWNTDPARAQRPGDVPWKSPKDPNVQDL